MNKITTVLIFSLAAFTCNASTEPDDWHAPLLTLPQIQERLSVGMHYDEVIRTIPYQVMTLNMPRSGALPEHGIAITTKVYPSLGIFCRFTDQSLLLTDVGVLEHPSISMEMILDNIPPKTFTSAPKR